MDPTLTTLEKDGVQLVDDLDAAIGRAENWANRILTGGLEARVLGNFATEILTVLNGLKAAVDELRNRIEPTHPAPEPAPTAQ